VGKAPRLPIDVSDLLDLNATLLRFIGHYCVEGFDETTAYKKTYPGKSKEMSSVEIRLEALHILNQRSVKIAVERFVGSVLDPYRDRIEHQFLEVLRNRAFYDPSDYFHPDGSVKSLDEIPREKRHAIDAVMRDFRGAKADAVLVNYKLSDKSQAMKQLTELLRKADGTEEAQLEVAEDHRNQVQSIMAGARAAIEGMKALAKESPKEKVAEKVAPVIKTVPSFEDDEPLMIEESDSSLAVTFTVDVENDPMVIKAKELVGRDNSGIGVDTHPMVERARSMATEKLKSKMDK